MANLSRLPKVIQESYEWQYDGTCASLSSDLFFLPDSLRAAAKDQHQRAAKAICGECPVQQRCLEHALSVREPYGVWGGTTPEERVAMIELEHGTAALRSA